ncbi:hypothetical protein BDY21DRAFT_350777 [Lineolata rhizophorae]|uniref:Uncharacterized protein n=1 Tax=Lineolata rhizophorae TaxID=578093 RepID=A0A6A6NVC9_9PEZI|nr:hypothetical protein BDY21DRAFT_350777 [Lineolata rhizophorae]
MTPEKWSSMLGLGRFASTTLSTRTRTGVPPGVFPPGCGYVSGSAYYPTGTACPFPTGTGTAAPQPSNGTETRVPDTPIFPNVARAGHLAPMM